MAETALRPRNGLLSASAPKLPGRGARLTIPPAVVSSMLSNAASTANVTANRMRHQGNVNTAAVPSPVNQNGCFEFDRVLKSGFVQKRTQKTKTWKHVYMVLRPNTLSIYKSEKESKLRHKIYLSELSTVTSLKDPKQKRHHLFGLYSPAKNYHFEAPTAVDAQQWIDLIRQDARIDEEEEEMFLASPTVRRKSYSAGDILNSNDDDHDLNTNYSTVYNTNKPIMINNNNNSNNNNNNNNNNSISAVLQDIPQDIPSDHDRFLSSSPEPMDPSWWPSHHSLMESSGLSGNELAYSDFSDGEAPKYTPKSPPISSPRVRPDRTLSQLSISNNPNSTAHNDHTTVEHDPDRVIWQGWLHFLRSKRGVRTWKDCWAVLRPRNLILYKDQSEYTAAFIIPLSSIVSVVDIDPISKTKLHCLQIITDEKSYRFCAHDEDALVRCLGAFKSLLSRRRELEARRQGSGTSGASGAGL